MQTCYYKRNILDLMREQTILASIKCDTTKTVCCCVTSCACDCADLNSSTVINEWTNSAHTFKLCDINTNCVRLPSIESMYQGTYRFRLKDLDLSDVDQIRVTQILCNRDGTSVYPYYQKVDLSTHNFDYNEKRPCVEQCLDCPACTCYEGYYLVAYRISTRDHIRLVCEPCGKLHSLPIECEYYANPIFDMFSCSLCKRDTYIKMKEGLISCSKKLLRKSPVLI